MSGRGPLLGLAGIVCGLACWQGLAPLVMLPAPCAVVTALANVPPASCDPGTDQMALLSLTLSSALGGWLIGGLVGFVLGLLLVESRLANRLLMPWVRMPASLPGAVAAFILAWYAWPDGPAALLAAWLALFPVAVATVAGLRAVPPHWLDVMRGFSASPLETFLALRLPAAAPQLFAGLRRALATALAAAAAAGFLRAPPSAAGLFLLAAICGLLHAALDWTGRHLLRNAAPGRPLLR